ARDDGDRAGQDERHREDNGLPAPANEVDVRVIEDAHGASSLQMAQMLNRVEPAGRLDRIRSNSVRDTNTAVKTLVTRPKNSVVANPRIGPVPNWNRNAAA